MKKPSQPAEVTSRGLVRLDKLLEHRSRLGACVLLADVEAMTFTSLKQLLQETDGNLGAHLRKLEDAGYLDCVQALREPQAGDLVPPHRQGCQGPSGPPRGPADGDPGGTALRCTRE